MKNSWSEEDIITAKRMLSEGYSYREIGEIINKNMDCICSQNKRNWHIKVDDSLNYEKRSRAMLRISDKISAARKGRWAGENNPNYGAKIVKFGKENPLSIWKTQNPGYQDGEKNPSFGREYSPEEIKIKTAKMVELNKARTGRTYKEIFGEDKAAVISQAMSKGAVKRLSKQKTSGTGIELKMKEILTALNVEYKFQYPIDYYCVDFFIPSKNLIIQTDGCYWHGCLKHTKDLNNIQKKNIRIDHSCNSFLINRGYKIIRVWECEMPLLEIECQIKSTKREEFYGCFH
jgi:DNA mismatch endonuclease (patch repair protein)